MFKNIILLAYRRIAWMMCRILPVQKNKIVISSYYGRGYGDNSKYIVSELLKSGEKPKIIWVVKNAEEKATLPTGVKGCKYNSFMSVYHHSTARVWIDNSRKEFRYKKKGQYYIQTWHGFALKRIEKDAQGVLEESYIKTAKHDSENIDLIISDSRFMTGIYKSAFWYDGEIAEWGSPRNDIIINSKQSTEIREKVFSFFGFEKDAKTVLYAPTFRANHSLEPYCVDYERLARTCGKRFGGSFTVLLRLHPNISKKSTQIKYDRSVVKDASEYTDMQELLTAADIVISDYSSLMFDFALSGKPVFQFATDIEDYKGDRNFYFELDKLPFALATDNGELEKNIEGFNIEEYSNRINGFFDSVGMVRAGNSAQSCARHILKIINE